MHKNIKRCNIKEIVNKTFIESTMNEILGLEFISNWSTLSGCCSHKVNLYQRNFYYRIFFIMFLIRENNGQYFLSAPAEVGMSKFSPFSHHW